MRGRGISYSDQGYCDDTRRSKNNHQTNRPEELQQAVRTSARAPDRDHVEGWREREGDRCVETEVTMTEEKTGCQ